MTLQHRAFRGALNTHMKTYLSILAASLALTSCQHDLPLPVPASPARLAALTEPAEHLYPVTFDVGCYSGGFMLDQDRTQIFKPGRPLYLAAGTHSLDVGGVARSAFTFDVEPITGHVSKVSNPHAAHAACTTLVLHTTPVTIDPGPLGSGGNRCELVAYPEVKSGYVTKAKTFHLIPGLRYQMDTGDRVGGSAFIFDVREDGTVWSGSHAASGGANQLRLNVGWLQLEPGNGAAKYYVGKSREFTGKARVPVIFGLITHLNVGTESWRFRPEFGDPERRVKVGGASFTVKVPWYQ
jgi:hypothetical protein